MSPWKPWAQGVPGSNGNCSTTLFFPAIVYEQDYMFTRTKAENGFVVLTLLPLQSFSFFGSSHPHVHDEGHPTASRDFRAVLETQCPLVSPSFLPSFLSAAVPMAPPPRTLPGSPFPPPRFSAWPFACEEAAMTRTQKGVFELKDPEKIKRWGCAGADEYFRVPNMLAGWGQDRDRDRDRMWKGKDERELGSQVMGEHSNKFYPDEKFV